MCSTREVIGIICLEKMQCPGALVGGSAEHDSWIRRVSSVIRLGTTLMQSEISDGRIR